MKSKAYEKYKEAKEMIRKGSVMVILDDEVTLVSTKVVRAGQVHWERFMQNQKILTGKPN